jgi:hypothetical protein
MNIWGFLALLLIVIALCKIARALSPAIAVLGIVAVACLIAFYIWSSHNRYYIVTGGQGVAYEVDRETGETWALLGRSKIRQQVGN